MRVCIYVRLLPFDTPQIKTIMQFVYLFVCLLLSMMDVFVCEQSPGPAKRKSKICYFSAQRPRLYHRRGLFPICSYIIMENIRPIVVARAAFHFFSVRSWVNKRFNLFSFSYCHVVVAYGFGFVASAQHIIVDCYRLVVKREFSGF